MIGPDAREQPAGAGLRFLDEGEVRRLRATYGTPLYVYDEASIRHHVERFLRFPNAFGLRVRYSIKANPNGAILQIMDGLGLQFDACSGGEVWRALRAGIAPERILLTAQEAPGDLDSLVARGVRFVAGSLRQLEIYGRAFPGSKVGIRINPGEGSGAIRRLTSGGPYSSFGIWHEAIPDALALARRHGLEVTRLHHHIGSGHVPVEWARLAESATRIAERLPDLEAINLGGGYPVRASAHEPEVDLETPGERVADAFRALAGRTGRRPVLEIEPGTALMAMAGCVVSTVHDVVSTGAGGFEFLKLDAGVNDVARPALYGAAHPLVLVPAEPRAPEASQRYAVVGHCCIAGDVLTTKRFDPEQLDTHELPGARPGDLLVIERAGAYCASMSIKHFNSFPDAPEVLRTPDGRFRVVRRRQTMEHMVENEVPLQAGAVAMGPPVVTASTKSGA